jgi:hypothetical protein
MTKKWRISARIPYPMEMETSEVGGATDFPEILGWKSRWVPQMINVEQLEVSLCRSRTHSYDVQSLLPSHCGSIVELVELRVQTIAESAQSALKNSRKLLEDICDDLAFQLQLPVPIITLEVVDITEPIAEGETREVLSYGAPGGYRHTKFQASAMLPGEIVEKSPGLKASYSIDQRTRAAIRWYHKALAAPYEIDRFIFLWIALEIIWSQTEVKDKKVYQNNCGHDIPNCPTCDATTERVVNGASLKRFLVEFLSVSEEQAKALWKYRQAVHGVNDLSDAKNEDLTTLVMGLKAAVSLGLKRLQGIPDHANPMVASQGVAVGIDFGLRMKVLGEDL